MRLPFQFKVYRFACIASLLVMAAILLNLVWIITEKGVRMDFQLGLFLIGFFFFINYKNAMAGLHLHTQLAGLQAILPKQRRNLKLYWALQLLLQLYVGMQMMGSLSRLFYRFKTGLIGNYTLATILSDILGTLYFLTATVCLILLWPFVRYVRLQYIEAQKNKRNNSEHVLTGFE
jgi:hypothetical protein